MNINRVKLYRLDELLRKEVDDGRLPGYSIAVGLGNEIIHQSFGGYAENKNGVTRLMRDDTIFDLASLTKVVATLPSILWLIDYGEIRLHDPVAKFIANFRSDPKSVVTVQHLLTHSSGLPSHRAYYQHSHSRDEIISMVKKEELECSPGTRVVYSDLGFILLGEIVRIITSKTIAEFSKEYIFQPLSMNETNYNPDKNLRDRIAATEESSGFGVKVGVVHDENAYQMDGFSGHAGLFAPISDLTRYVKMWLTPSISILSESVRHIACQCHTDRLNGCRGLGWTYRRDSFDHSGDLWPPTTVGHTGFTGTSITMDPSSKLWTILLTNRVHYGRDNLIMKELREKSHNIIASSLTDI